MIVETGLTGHYTENAWLASVGGGIGGYWGHVRSDGTITSGGSQSSGSIPFLHVVDSEILAFLKAKQTRKLRRIHGYITPRDYRIFEMRKPSGGDVHRKCLNLHHGVNIPDSFMQLIDNCIKEPTYDDSWNLIDPHTKKLYGLYLLKNYGKSILETRVATGEPYVSFIDTINDALPETQKDKQLKVHHSNLCTEITLPTSDNVQQCVVCLL